MTNFYDNDWPDRANDALLGARTGAVPELDFTARVDLRGGSDESESILMRVADGATFFLSALDGPPNVSISIGKRSPDELFADDQARLMSELIASGELQVDGDLALASFFESGLIRNATPATLARLRSA